MLTDFSASSVISLLIGIFKFETGPANPEVLISIMSKQTELNLSSFDL